MVAAYLFLLFLQQPGLLTSLGSWLGPGNSGAESKGFVVSTHQVSLLLYSLDLNINFAGCGLPYQQEGYGVVVEDDEFVFVKELHLQLVPVTAGSQKTGLSLFITGENFHGFEVYLYDFRMALLGFLSDLKIPG
jgi:hypothetical protein